MASFKRVQEVLSAIHFHSVALQNALSLADREKIIDFKINDNNPLKSLFELRSRVESASAEAILESFNQNIRDEY